MRKIITLLAATLLALSLAVLPSSAESEPLELHCPGAVDASSPNYVPVADGYEIVLTNDMTEEGTHNDLVLAAGTLVCVKGGPEATGMITADGTSTLKQLLGQYVTVGLGNVPDVSYYMTYTTSTDIGDWCSPGFWRNSPLQAAAVVAEGNVVWPAGASAANYVEILNNPQQYASTGLFEAVADALSAAHAGVDFLGERVEDSCPLRADAAESNTKVAAGKQK